MTRAPIVNESTNQWFTLTFHALQRWEERGPAGGDIAEYVRKAVKFGGQFGNKELYYHDGYVFPVAFGSTTRRVVTVLTVRQAIANLASQGVRINYRALLPKGCPPQTPLRSTEERLATLAAEHALYGVGRKGRSDALKANGFDPGTVPEGPHYRIAFAAAQKLMQALNAACRNEAEATERNPALSAGVPASAACSAAPQTE
jgi:hypothetical protein